jgi:hypothetical protein
MLALYVNQEELLDRTIVATQHVANSAPASSP